MEFAGTLVRIRADHAGSLKDALTSINDVRYVVHQTSIDEEQHLSSFQFSRDLSEEELVYLSLRAGIELRPQTDKVFFLLISD